MKKIDFDPTKTILVITVGFLIIYYFTSWQWSLITSLIIGLIGVLSARLSEIVNYLWIRLTIILSYIVPNILLAMIYYFVLVPMAFMSKIFRKGDDLKLNNRSESTFFDVNREIDKASLKNMW